MNRVITAYCADEFIKKSSAVAGAAGSHNAVTLRLSFSEAWEGTTKKTTFIDARGQNPVCIICTTDKLVEGEAEVYDVPIPGEALAFSGQMSVTVRGVTVSETGGAERIVMSATTQFNVLEVEPECHPPAEPTPTQAEQLQAEIDAIKGDIIEAAESAEAAAASASAAEAAKAAAEGFADSAGSAAQTALSAQTGAETAREGAEAAKLATDAAKVAAESARDDARGSAYNAEGSAFAAQGARTGAELARTGAESAKAAAETAQTRAETARDAALSAETASKAARDAAQSAQSAAQAAKAAAESARDISVGSAGDAVAAKTAAETAKALAETARAAADLAAGNAQAAKTAAETAKTAAEAARDTAVNSATVAQSAKTAAESAKTAAEAAQGASVAAKSASEAAASAAAVSEGKAAVSASDAEAWAVGKRGGVDVGTGDPAYQNNAKWYKDQAAEIVGGDYPTKSEAQGYVNTHNASGTAHGDIRTAAATAQSTANTALSTAQGAQTAADGKIPLTQKGAANGVASLGTDGKVPSGQLPPLNYDPAGSAAAVQGNLNTHTADAVKHITAGERTAWNAKQNALTAGTDYATPAQVNSEASTRAAADTALEAGKANKKVPAAAGNLAALGADGNLVDSGKQAGDFGITSPTATALGLAENATVDDALKLGATVVHFDNAPGGTLQMVSSGLPSVAPWNALAYGNGVHVAIAGGTEPSDQAAFSKDGGKTWQLTTMPKNTYWHSVAYGQGKFIATAGNEYSDRYEYAVYAQSFDGEAWEVPEFINATSGYPLNMTEDGWGFVACGDGVFIMITGGFSTSGLTYRSTDGYTWTRHSGSFATRWGGIAYGDGAFVIVPGGKKGIGNTFKYSLDAGVTWNHVTVGATGGSRGWTSVAYGKGIFVAVARNAVSQYIDSIYSEDRGQTWKTSNMGVTCEWQSITFDGEKFIAVGKNPNKVVYSYDGKTAWTEMPMTVDAPWSAITCDSGSPAIISNNSNIAAYGRYIDPDAYLTTDVFGNPIKITQDIWVSLFDVTVNDGTTTTVEMDLSGIDMTQYSELRLCKIPATANATMFVRLNRQTNYHYRDYLKNWGSGVGTACNFTEGYADFCLASSNVYVYDITMFYRAASTIKIPNFTTIGILASIDGTANLAQGDRFVLMGMKKW